MNNHERLRTFLIIWFGQVISMLGTAMTGFALTIWAYEQTGRATTLALQGFFMYFSYALVGLVAGIWVDRWDRRRVMIVADLGAALVTLVLLGLYSRGAMRVGHLYAAQTLSGVFSAFQSPANNAAMTLLIPRKHLTRANGLRTLGQDMTQILAPALAGLLLVTVGLRGVMWIDLSSALFATSTLLIVRIPRPPVSTEGQQARGATRWQTFTFGLRYIVRRRGLFWMMVIYMLINLYAGLTWFGVLTAMVLSRSGGSESVLSVVRSAMGIGGVLGGLVLTIWGGPKRQVHGMLGIAGVSFLLGDGVLALGRTPAVWIAGGLMGSLAVPSIISSNRSIWQSKVPPDVQGRVLGAAMALQSATTPIGFLLAGPLADRLLEPAMQPGGALVNVFGSLTGTGPGAGMGVMFLLTGLAGCLTCFGGYLIADLRNVERLLPDADLEPVSLSQTGAALAGD
ncbi:MAG: MFS transporter [Anaerolineae bacterium]|nr:MFS transporter [Anaerolineae bacterium]